MARQARADTTRQAILEAASTVFVRAGYSAASVSDIAAEVGLTKGALYFHFPSKERLARAVMEAQLGITAGLRDEYVDTELSALEILVSLTSRLGRRMQDDIVVRAGIRLAVEVGIFGDEPIVDSYEVWRGPVAGLLAAGIEEGDVRPDLEPTVAASFLVSAFTGVQTVSTVERDLVDLPDRIRDMLAIVLPALVVPERQHRIPALLALV